MGFFDKLLSSLQPQPKAEDGDEHGSFEQFLRGKPATLFEDALAGRHSGDVLMYLGGYAKGVEAKESNPWTVAHAFEGTQIFGETGSGKTSGSGAALAVRFLKNGFGGLVLTAKTTDVYDWVNPDNGFLRQAGIDPSDPNKVVVIGERLTKNFRRPAADKAMPIDTQKSFNFLAYEYERTGQAVFNLVQLFITALESGSQGNTGQEDAYWMDALRQLLTNAIQLVTLATGTVSLDDIHAVIQTAPQSREQARSRKWQSGSSVCWDMLQTAESKVMAEVEAAQKVGDEDSAARAESQLRSFRQIVNYWLLDFAGLADRTRSVIVSTFTAKVTGLTRWPLFDLLCRDTTQDESFVDIVEATRGGKDREIGGKVVIINLPVKRYTEVGRFAQILIKTVWQRGIERAPDPSRPVFLWADESQFFATREDVLFQTTARSSGCATVYLTQNICNYYSMMPGKDPKSATDALLGNLATKIFHANGDPTTNDWTERVFGKAVQYLGSKGKSVSGENKVNLSDSKQQSLLPIVAATELTVLRKGGPENDLLVDAYIFQGGRVWKGRGAKFNRIFVNFPQYKS